MGELFLVRTTPAPAVPGVAAPTAIVTADVTTADVRTLTLQARLPGGGFALTTDMRADGGIRGATVNGTAVGEATAGRPDQVRVAAFGPAGPVTIQVTVARGQGLDVRLTGYWLGYPDNLPVQLRPRTAGETSGAYEATDGTVVTRTLTVPAPAA